ncbi:DUF4412 domain-containing protein [Caldichromatium japonicum]|uniref:DUF4412 domain-containing protein n=1 Tax=Caldichromatium japonicum TaxID=2699430 RepID=A0A6G7VB37_9GAMM|nr:DUF4412 domain-containing protein [Caldichromatium japonicum]QIK37279.1 DUF4412 domain-containing protein [Caldichromatium japonicum]
MQSRLYSFPFIHLLALLAILSSPWTFADEEGILIETLNRQSGLTGEAPSEEASQTLVAYGKMKIASTDPQGTDMIIDPSSGDLTFLNHATKEYYRLNARAILAGISQPGVEQMRALLEQTRITVEPTDETRQINGFHCRKYRVSKTGLMDIEQEVWATEEIQLDLDRYNDLMRLSGPEGLLGDSEAARAQRAEMQKIKGYPILTISKVQMMGTEMETQTEVRAIRKESMSKALFEIPADYKERSMGDEGEDMVPSGAKQ